MDADSMLLLRRTVSQLFRQLNATEAAEGMTPSQVSAFCLIASRGPLGLAELTALEGLNPTMVSRIVGRLESLDLVQRQRDPSDLRSAAVRVTGRGRQLHRRIRTQRAALIAQGLSNIPPDQQQMLENALPVLESLIHELRAPQS